MSLPDLFVYAERSVFIHEAGMTYYQMTFENSSYYQVADLLFITYSFVLVAIVSLWLRKRLILTLILAKIIIFISK